jgi:hypothetical protein
MSQQLVSQLKHGLTSQKTGEMDNTGDFYPQKKVIYGTQNRPSKSL